MQRRHLWLVAVIALGVVLGYWWNRRSAGLTPVAGPPATSQLSAPIAAPATIPATTPVTIPAPKSEPPAVSPTAPPVAAIPAAPNPEVPIEENKTIDFSGGKAVVKSSAEEKAIIDAAVKEMNEATKDITFDPTTPSSVDNKKAEPAGAPPK